jgi:serine/threonine protein kinase
VPPRSSSDLVLSGSYGYEKLSRLGRGEFGEVWRARAPGGVEVAVKIILRNLDHEASQRELKAMEKIRELRHPFLLQTHQYRSEEDHLVIVMELADGSLHDRFKECQKKGLTGIPVEELLRYFAEAAEALDYLHSKHVMHRAVKPQNILTLKGHAKVADFGLARQVATPAYMAPEVYGGHAGPASDLYALAYAYAELRLGHRPFKSSDLATLMYEHLQNKPDLSALPAAEQAVLHKALDKKPDRRYPTCSRFVEELQRGVAR